MLILLASVEVPDVRTLVEGLEIRPDVRVRDRTVAGADAEEDGFPRAGSILERDRGFRVDFQPEEGNAGLQGDVQGTRSPRARNLDRMLTTFHAVRTDLKLPNRLLGHWMTPIKEKRTAEGEGPSGSV